MPRTLLAIALMAICAAPAIAADGPDLTLYNGDNANLFRPTGQAVDSGHAMIHETRALALSKGTQRIVFGNLPDYLDPEAVMLSFPSSRHIKLISQRLLLSQGHNGTLTGHIGKQVTVEGGNGQNLAQGTLAGVGGDGSLLISGDVFGPTIVRNYAAVRLTGGQIGGGSRLQVKLDSGASGRVKANLTYPTAGLGWRAAYSATLQPDHSCRMRFHARASIANRSGRDWNNAQLKLVAGKPNFTQSSGPHPVAMMARAKNTPQQDTLGDYRTFTLPGRVDLPSNSVTQSPLYEAHTLDCERTWDYENGNTFQPSQPMTSENYGNGSGQDHVTSDLRFKAFDSFPSGTLRVLSLDKDGHAEFIGEGNIGDTPKGGAVHLVLGRAFDLTGNRQRTAFRVDNARHSMDESFRVTLSNAGKTEHTVTVREHPDRWNNWSLTSSSQPPSKTGPDTLEFHVKVPGNGKATLDYSVHYSWTAADER